MEDAGRQLFTLRTTVSQDYCRKPTVLEGIEYPYSLPLEGVGNLKAYSCTCIQCSFPGYHYKGYPVMLRNPQGIFRSVTLASSMLSSVIEEPISAQNGEK